MKTIDTTNVWGTGRGMTPGRWLMELSMCTPPPPLPMIYLLHPYSLAFFFFFPLTAPHHRVFYIQ